VGIHGFPETLKNSRYPSTEGESLQFVGIPTLHRKYSAILENADPMKSKQLAKGVDQLMDEGWLNYLSVHLTGEKLLELLDFAV